MSNSKTPIRPKNSRPFTPTSCSVLPKSYTKTPKTPLQKTPNKNNFTARDADRFIPNRQATDVERGHYFLLQENAITDENANNTDIEYKQAVVESICPNNGQGDKILGFISKQAPRPVFAPLHNVPNARKKAVSQRFIPKSPQKILDAPALVDDFYLNILDWSLDNNLAIALNNEVYVWNAETGDINFLMHTDLESDYVSSLIWSRDSPSVISVGTSSGSVQLWDSTQSKLMRTMIPSGSNGFSRIPVQAWHDHIISAGSRSGGISHHDIRIPSHEIGSWGLHIQEVCGLAWSPDGRNLASGGNDNTLAIWSSDEIPKRTNAKPMHTLLNHKAAVKAIAWCPWKPTLLCSGGGSADHHLRFWNAGTGNALQAFDVGAQVSFQSTFSTPYY
ncbi:unnamed protein product [Protopolystoma xenopodis]|uniref:CDC20/Fizzy WD40 domain-containing protein n=1 Tax=Protopolystoma xenopodis TaxID=117903 RepID=A0A3S4ZS12_9PLAT|nr:unnamed protein product [Protopolystoma xenopodis]